MLRTRSGAPAHAARPLLRYLTEAFSRSGYELLHVGGTRKDAVRLSYENPLLQRVGLTGQLLLLGSHTRSLAGASATIRVAAWPGGTFR